MKQKHLAGLAALMVSAMGGAAFGDHHISGGQVDCSGVPFDCFDDCLALKSCLEIPESGGTTTCASESSALAACEARSGSGPGGGSGGGVIIIPACQGGRHYHVGGGCHADHECGDDEIGGGSEECQACGEGEVPNEDGTACESCPHGEISDQPGECWPARFLVASCTRPLESAPWGIRDFLPYHVNVLVEQTDKAGSRLERGFFAIDMQEAVTLAIAWRLNPFRPWMDPVFTPGEVRQDGNLGECVYEPVYAVQRYETVRQRMETYDWTNYHLVEEMSGRYGYGSCITWANSVLAY